MENNFQVVCCGVQDKLIFDIQVLALANELRLSKNI